MKKNEKKKDKKSKTKMNSPEIKTRQWRNGFTLPASGCWLRKPHNGFDERNAVYSLISVTI
jgi:hypothetical protein